MLENRFRNYKIQSYIYIFFLMTIILHDTDNDIMDEV